jgi:hypothetical protein
MSGLQKIINDKIKELRVSYGIRGKTFEQKEREIRRLYEIYEKNEHYEQIEENDLKKLEVGGKIVKDSPIYHFCSLRAIKKIVEAYEIDDPEYVDYPDKLDKKFEEKIYKKEEFNMFETPSSRSGSFNICDTSEFEIAPHQLFLKNFLTKETPYSGVLLFHGVGVGKTCSAITISENFRDIYGSKEKRIIILCSKNIKLGWKKTIFNPDIDENQCSGNIFLNRNIKTKREVNRLVRDYYEIMAYLSFANHVKRIIKVRGRRYLNIPEEEREKLVIREVFSNRLLIIDEAHNLRDDGEKDLKDSVEMIEKVIRYSDNLKIILLSATPMYNRSTEIIRMMNFLLMNDKRELLDKAMVFDKAGKITKQGQAILKTASRGYVSYVRGEDPSSFPVRLYPSYTKSFSSYDASIRGKRAFSLILDRDNYPKRDMKNTEIVGSNKLAFLETFGSRMKENGHQWVIYNRLEKEVIKSGTDGEALPSIKDINRIIRAGNIVYPYKQDENDSVRVDECISASGLKNTFSVRNKSRSQEYTYKKDILRMCGPFLDKDLIGEYSAKIKVILDLIERTDGIVFVYSNWIKSGVIPLILALEQNGYKKFSGEKVLNYPDYNRDRDEYETKRKPQVLTTKDGDFEMKYMVISGGEEKLSTNLEEELKVVTSAENWDGRKIKIVIGSSVASEGIDFKRIRSVHILEPWLHLNRIEQTIGRGIRFCSHGDLDEQKRNVMVYLHTIVNSDDREKTIDDKETIDNAVYRYAEKKAIDIGIIEDILKRNAVDRLLFRDKNIVGEKDVIESEIISPLDNIKIDYAPNDKPYSKICSYLPKAQCNFNKELSKIKYTELFTNTNINDDTINYNYSGRYIEVVIKRIIELYTLKVVYQIDEILQVLAQFYSVDEKIVFFALRKMIQDKRVISNNYGIRGQIIYRGKYYIFQPTDITDKNIPYYYRCLPEIKYPSSIYLPKEEKQIDKLIISDRYELSDISMILNDLNSPIDTDKKYATDEDIYMEIFEDIDIFNYIIREYKVDRLNGEDKVKLIYTILMKLYENKELFTILSYNFIYKKQTTYKLRYEINDKDIDKDIFGFYIVYHHAPQFFAIEDGLIRKINTFERKDIQKDLTSFSRTDVYRRLVKTEKFWGYLTSQKSHKKENVVFKVVDDTSPEEKSKVFPPGPGKMCEVSTLGFKKHDILNMIIKAFGASISDTLVVTVDGKEDKIISLEKDNLSPKITFTLESGITIADTDIIFHDTFENIYKDKHSACKIFEILCRYNREKNNMNNYLSYDEIWLKYPPFTFIDITEIE